MSKLFSLLLACVCSSLLWAEEKRVTVDFINPESFTDFSTTELHRENEHIRLMTELRIHIERAAGRSLPEGAELAVSFRDVDLAGESVTNTSRVQNELYQPVLKFDYKVTDAGGSVLASGSETLEGRNSLVIQSREKRYKNRGLAQEKALLDQWILTLLEEIEAKTVYNA